LQAESHGRASLAQELLAAVSKGYWYARSEEFLHTPVM
jgi:hypothetical protein